MSIAITSSVTKSDKVTLFTSNDDFDAWLAIAKKSSYKNFAEKVPGGQKLIDQALAVK